MPPADSTTSLRTTNARPALIAKHWRSLAVAVADRWRAALVLSSSCLDIRPCPLWPLSSVMSIIWRFPLGALDRAWPAGPRTPPRRGCCLVGSAILALGRTRQLPVLGRLITPASSGVFWQGPTDCSGSDRQPRQRRQPVAAPRTTVKVIRLRRGAVGASLGLSLAGYNVLISLGD